MAGLWDREEGVKLSWWLVGMLWCLSYMLNRRLQLLYWLYHLPVCCISCLCYCLLVKDLHHLLSCLYHLLSRLHCRPCSWQNEPFDSDQILTNTVEFLVLGLTRGQWWSGGMLECSPIHRLRRRWKTWFGS